MILSWKMHFGLSVGQRASIPILEFTSAMGFASMKKLKHEHHLAPGVWASTVAPSKRGLPTFSSPQPSTCAARGRPLVGSIQACDSGSLPRVADSCPSLLLNDFPPSTPNY